MLEANIILSKCSVHNDIFAIRIEKHSGDWVRTWAFKIDDKKAKREGFDNNKMTGTLNATSDFPGCPYCGEHGFARCSCGKLSCLKLGVESAPCHWCGITMENFVNAESFDVSGGGF